MEKTQLLLLHRPEFLKLLRESGEFAFTVIEWMSEMLREKTATIQSLATPSPENRVGAILLRLGGEDCGDGRKKILLRRQDIARMAGFTTETTIRVIRRLAEKGFIEIVRGKIYIDDDGPLRRHVEG